jgi:S1-C subfamily serine protease
MLMRKLVVAMLAVALAGVGLAHADERGGLDAKQVIQKVRKGVLRVQTADVNALDNNEAPNSVGVGGGSGFIFEIDYDNGTAYAITNYHVAGHAAYVSVTAWNGKVYNGSMVAAEPGIDITLIKLNGVPDERNLPDDQKNLVPIVLGDSDKVRVGEPALAMGSPGTPQGIETNRSDPYSSFMLDQTANLNVVTGRFSPLDWEIDMWGGGENGLNYEYATNVDYAFRMSTPINHGNSGGPLINNRGEVIGINTWTLVGTGAFPNDNLGQGHNLAVPINLAKDFAYQVINTGKFQKPWVGLDLIFPASVKSDEDYQEFRERFRGKQLEVYGVRRGSPAEQAGFKRGDIIVDINGQKFKEPEDVRLWIFTQDIGAPLACRVIRDGHMLSEPITVNVGAKRSYDSEFSV